MNQLEANEKTTEEMNTNINNLNDHLVPLPIRVLREATVILENPEAFLLPPTLPNLERITSTYGKHSSAGVYQDDASDDLPPIPKLPSKKDIILEVYKQDLVHCPGLKFHEEHYSGLPFDPINLTHLRDDIREHLNNKLEYPELKRQVNYPSLANLTDVSILDEMPAENPVFRRMDGIGDYKNI